MNLVRSIAAVIGTLGVALAAGSLFQQADQGRLSGQATIDPGAASTASLAPSFSDALMEGDRTATPGETPPSQGTARGAIGLAAGSFGAASPLADLQAENVDTRAEANAGIATTDPGTRPPLAPEFAPEAAGEATADDRAAVPVTDADGPAGAPALAELSLPVEPDPCAVWLVVTPADAAMLDTSVYAPCHAGQRADFEHAGLRFSQTIGADGQLLLYVPALRADARVSITLPDGTNAEDETRVPDMAEYDRLVLGWTGNAALSLHAYADGASFGGEGHIHSDFTGTPGHAPFGFLSELGDVILEDPALAQVYTFPEGLRAGSGRIDLTVDAAITESSCGAQISARTVLSHGGEAGAARSVTVSLPACDGIDGFLSIDGLIVPQAEGMAQAG